MTCCNNYACNEEVWYCKKAGYIIFFLLMNGIMIRIAAWTKEMGLQLINFTPGTKSTCRLYHPEMKNYRSSEDIYNSIINYEQSKPAGLNGFIF